MAWCLQQAGVRPAAENVRFVPHHTAHAASAAPAARFEEATRNRACSVLSVDGRREAASHLAGRVDNSRPETLASPSLPHSLGLRYGSPTIHLGLLRSSDEDEAMTLYEPATVTKPTMRRRSHFVVIR